MILKMLLCLGFLGAPIAGFAKDCGIVPKGASYGPNCELIPAVAPQKISSLQNSKQKELVAQAGMDTVQIGIYSGKPGYYVNIGSDFGLKIDAMVMNEAAFDELTKIFSATNLGETKNCQVRGLQQAQIYSIFTVKNCK